MTGFWLQETNLPSKKQKNKKKLKRIEKRKENDDTNLLENEKIGVHKFIVFAEIENVRPVEERSFDRSSLLLTN
jgi:hypothetical protein